MSGRGSGPPLATPYVNTYETPTVCASAVLK